MREVGEVLLTTIDQLSSKIYTKGYYVINYQIFFVYFISLSFECLQFKNEKLVVNSEKYITHVFESI